jgi:hypothetical protein
MAEWQSFLTRPAAFLGSRIWMAQYCERVFKRQHAGQLDASGFEQGLDL